MKRVSSKDELAMFGTEPVRARPYYDPEYLVLEREAVFKKTWLAIGRVEEVPEVGDFIVREIEIAKATLLIVRGKDREVRAFHNTCPHRGAQIVGKAQGNAPALSCPYHRWTFNLDGSLRGIPDKKNFFAVDEHDCDLSKVHVGEVGGFLFVCLSEPEQSLEQFLGGAADVLRGRNTAIYDTYVEINNVVQTNWKSAQDNFQETYHVGAIHQKTLVPMVTSPSNPYGYPWYEIYEPHHRMRMWRNFDFLPPFFSGLTAPPRNDSEEVRSVDDNGGDGLDVLALFPNFHVNNDIGRYWTHQFWPIDVDRTRLVGRIYLKKARTARERVTQEFMVAATKDVWAEDWPLLIAVQKGIQSGAIEHIHFQAHEFPCRHVYNGIVEQVARHQATKVEA